MNFWFPSFHLLCAGIKIYTTTLGLYSSGDETQGLMLAGQALYQLSYSPSLHIYIYVLLTHICCWGDDRATQGLLRGLAGLGLWTA